MRANFSSGIAPVWLKSKRSRSGVTSEPAWRTCWPSSLRSTACRICVAEWLSMVLLPMTWIDREMDFVADLNAAFFYFAMV